MIDRSPTNRPLLRGLLRWVAPCVAAAIPLAIAPGLLFYYDVTPKVVLLYLGTAAALPFANPRRLLASTSGRILCALLAALFASAVLSSAFSVRADLSILGTNWRRLGLLTQSALLLFALVVASDLSGGVGRLRAYLRASVMATLLVALYAILQYLGWDPWLDPRTYHVGSGEWIIVRPPGSLGYVTYLANYLVFGAGQGLALYRMEDKSNWRWMGLAATVLAVVGILLGGTRAAWLALLAGALMLLWLERCRPSARAALLAVGIALVAVAFYFSPAGLQLRSRMRWFREDPAGGARLYLWRDSVRLISRHWLLGSGPETFSVEFPQVQSRDLSRAYPEFYHESTHNIFLDAGTAQGLPGLLTLLATVVLGLRAKRSDRPERGVLLAGFVAILVCHQFSVFTVATALTFWITLATLTAGEGTPEPQTPDRRMLWLLPVSLLLIVAAGRLAIADRRLAQARTALGASHFADAQSHYLAAGQLGLHADLWYSRKLLAASEQTPKLMDRIALTQQALASGITATATAEDPYNAWMNLGLIYAKLDNANRTEYCIRQAIIMSPRWYKSHLALAQLLVATKRRDEAQKEMGVARDLNPTKPPR